MTCTLSLGSGVGHCHWCDKLLVGRQKRWCSRQCGWEWSWNHLFTKAKKKKKAFAAQYECEHCSTWTNRIEVNHIVQAMGAHSKASCVHHLDNLEILCIPCHRLVTAEQRKK